MTGRPSPGQPKPKEQKRTGPILSPAKRREKIEDLFGTAAKLVRGRGGEVNVATASVLEDNAEMLAEAYGKAAEASAPFARALDSMLTGGTWGQLLIANSIVFVQIAMIRGWLRPDQLPGPVGAMFAPPPSEEQMAEAARRARASAGQPRPSPAATSRAPQSPPPPPPPPRKPSPAAPGDRDYRGEDPGPVTPAAEPAHAERPVVGPPPRPDAPGRH